MRRGFNLIELVVVIAIIAVLIALIMPNTWMPETLVTLALGWVTYLWRVIPKLNPDPWTVATAVACLALVILGTHRFLRWLAGGEWRWSRTLRCVGLLVLMFVAGIAVVGVTHQTSWLAQSPEPFLVSRGGVRTHSANNLKQMAIAADNHREATDEFPRSRFDATGRPMHSWQTAILPYIEQLDLYRRIDQKKPWTDPANAKPLGERVKVYMNAYYSREDNVNGLGISHYAGNATVVLGDPKKLDDFPAGTSQTILAGEVSANFRAWGDPLNARDPRLGGTGHPHGFGGPNGRPAQFVMLDGSVKTLDPKAIADLLNKPLE